MVSISNLPSKNRGRALLKEKVFVFSLSSLLFPLFHLYMARYSDLAQFSCPTGHTIEWS